MEPQNWAQGAPTPIGEGFMSPNMEVMNLLTGFATGHVIVEEHQLKHLPTITESLKMIWETPKRKKEANGGAIHTKKAKIAQKEPHKNISKQLAQQKPHTKVPDLEIKLENIIPGSPTFVPCKRKTPMVMGKGKGVKNIKLNGNDNSDSDMVRMKKTETNVETEERLRIERKKKDKAKQKMARATKSAKAAKNIIPKS